MRLRFASTLILLLGLLIPTHGSGLNPVGFPIYTFETAHFRIHYHQGVEHVAVEVGAILEDLYDVFKNTYHIVMPVKTEAIVVNSVEANGWAMDLTNTILVSANAFDFNMRGTHDWLRDVVTHEYAHLMSITTSHKWPSAIPYMQAGFFSHPNNTTPRLEALHVLPLEILPPWLFEGIAQFESSRRGADRWDSHRDMILRTLTLSNKLLSYDRMFVFSGRGDDYEKTYDHGFALVRYIAETYGFEKIVSIMRESSKLPRLNFDRSIKAVLGISSRRLYADWVKSMKDRYGPQVKSLGPQVYGRKINKKGYDNSWPRFSPDEKKIFFISNGDNDYSYYYRSLHSYNLVDTVKDDDRIKVEMGKIKGGYSINDSLGLISWVSQKSRKSELPLRFGGGRTPDVFIDTLPPEKKRFRPFHKSERQVTSKRWAMHAALSPAGTMLACSQQSYNKFFLCLTDSAGKEFRVVYPDTTDTSTEIRTMFSIDWSPDGHRIAVSYIDVNNRKIGIYDTLTREFTVICDTEHDERDPRFNRDGTRLYFASDRTGIYNIYRYEFSSSKLERLTNVSGGAFMPDMSRDEKRLVYTNYDADGHGIYQIDTLRTLEELGIDTMRTTVRTGVTFESLAIKHTPRKKYSLMPRKVMIIPTFLVEQAVTQSDNIYKGKSTAKVGAIIDLFDPIVMSGIRTGSSLGGYALIDATKLTKFIDVGKGLINFEVDYDLGLFGATNLLPIPFSFNYLQRSVTGTDAFWYEPEQAIEKLFYNVTFYDMYMLLSYGSGGGPSDPPGGSMLHLMGSLGQSDVTLALSELAGGSYTPTYTTSKDYMLGAFGTFLSYTPEQAMAISPRGLYATGSILYTGISLIDDENTVDLSKPEYLKYQTLRGTANVKTGIPAPWYDKHTLYLDVGAMASRLLLPRDYPYYYEPEILWQPGYAYFQSDTFYEQVVLAGPNRDTIEKKVPYTRGVIEGAAVTYCNFSFRFPIWPGSINQKISFLFLERLFGAVNYGSAAGWRELDDLTFTNTNELARIARSRNWLHTVGAELRLEAQSFSRLPVALTARWDYGIDRPAPVGGHRYTLGLGFSFDYWENIIVPPDYSRRPGREVGASKFRMR